MKPYFTLTVVAILFLVASCKNESGTPTRYEAVERPVENVSQGDTTTGQDEFSNLVADYESKNRVIWQKPEMVINLLGDLKGKTVADIGAGTGYFAFRILPKAGHVIAVDIDPRFISFLDSTRLQLPDNLQQHFESRLAKPNDPLLKPCETDRVIIVNTYMYIQNRVNYLRVLKKGMSKDAKLLIIDYKDKHTPVGPPANIRVPLNTVEKELAEAGFRQIVSDDTSLDYQYIVTAIN